eukprot:TRINITY_DN2102_c0_g1_i7.p1 TRINITY_DN2102_c0_g1~~TRINITY_DN2102_c0_g1_i7.p1  ORF type:complete len:237 (+),score=57.14 TRINITY_DN2102_c0_g1_i7:153-863(+)
MNEQANPGMGQSSVLPAAKYKIVFLGNQSVGKTSIINRFIFDIFDLKNHPTVGIDFVSKTIYQGDKTIRLQLWDTAGQERFRSLIPSYIRDSSVAVVVYDVTSRQTFDDVDRWIKDVKDERGAEVLVVIVGNKSDLLDRQVTAEDLAEKAKRYECFGVEVSAKTGDKIQDMFNEIVQALPGGETSQILSTTNGNINNAQAGQPAQGQKPGVTPTIQLGATPPEGPRVPHPMDNKCC